MANSRTRIRRPRKSVEITLGGEVWTLVFAPCTYQGEECWGLTYHDDNKIAIDPRVFNPQTVAKEDPKRHVTPRSVVLHEIFHASMPWGSEPFVDALSIEIDNVLDELDL